MDDATDGEAEELVDLAHPVGVAAGEIVVDGDDMDAFAGQGIEIDGKGRDQRLAFAGLHLGDAAFVENHAADQLDVEMALAEGALGGLADGGEGGSEKIVERAAVLQLPAKLGGAGLQVLIAQLFESRLRER